MAVDLGLEVPAAAAGRNISITTEVSGSDYSGDAYYATDTHELFVGPYISITKAISGNKSTSGEIVASTNEQLQVSLKVKNTNDVPVELTVSDSVPESFELEDTQKLEWEMQIDPHTTNEITYTANPTIPGNFTLGNAIATWEDNGNTYEVTSTDPEVLVNGSYVVAEKTVSSEYAIQGETVTVTLQISNKGDETVDVTAHDNVHMAADIISGSLEWSGKLAPGETAQQTYEIAFSEPGEYTLPKLEVDYTDKTMKEATVYSQQIEMYIDNAVTDEEIDKTETAAINSVADETQTSELTNVQAAGFLVSSFAGLFCIVSMIPVVVLFLVRKAYK
jgi:hypothetical protein